MDYKYDILLTNDTVGTIYTDLDLNVADKVTVDLHDENGMSLQQSGKIKEILWKEELD